MPNNEDEELLRAFLSGKAVDLTPEKFSLPGGTPMAIKSGSPINIPATTVATLVDNVKDESTKDLPPAIVDNQIKGNFTNIIKLFNETIQLTLNDKDLNESELQKRLVKFVDPDNSDTLLDLFKDLDKLTDKARYGEKQDAAIAELSAWINK